MIYSFYKLSFFFPGIILSCVLKEKNSVNQSYQLCPPGFVCDILKFSIEWNLY